MEEWKTPERRNLMVSKIAEAMRAYPGVLNRSPSDIESTIYQKAKVEVEYNLTVDKVIISIKNQGQRQQVSEPTSVQPTPSSSTVLPTGPTGVQPTPPNQMQPMNLDDNIRHIIDAYMSPNAPDRMRAIAYLKDHPKIISPVIMKLERQGRVQEAKQLHMETGNQQPYGYPVPQALSSSTVLPAGPVTHGDISTPKPPPSITILPSPMQNPGTPFASPYTPMAKPQEPSANMAMQQPAPPNQMQPMNPDDNIRHIIDAYMSPNAPDKMRAITYLKDHPGIISRVIMMLQRQGRVQEAKQLRMETGNQQPYGYPVPQAPSSSTVLPAGPLTRGSNLPSHQQSASTTAAAAARYRPNTGYAGGPMDPQQQMIRSGLPQQQYYNTPRPLHPTTYLDSISYMPGMGPSPAEIMPQHSQPYMAGQPLNLGIGNIGMGGTMPYGQQMSEIQQRPPPYVVAGGPQPGMGVEQSYSALPNLSFRQQDTSTTNMFSKPPATSSPFVDGPPSAVPVSPGAPPPSGPALQHDSTPRKPSSMASSSPAISPEENDAYMQKLQELQPYVPLVARMIEKYSRQEGGTKSEEYLKLNALYSLLTDKNKRVPLQTLVKCKKALEKLFETPIDVLLGQQTASTPLPPSSASDPPQTDDAETDFAVVKEHIKQQGSVDVLSLKSYLIGPSRVGKTTTLRRLTGKIDHLSPDEIVPSTGIEAPLTVQLYTHQVEQSSVLVSEGWQIQELKEQCQSLFSHIRNSATHLLARTNSPSSKNCISEQIESSTVEPTESADTVSSFPTQSKPVVQDDIISQFTLPIDLENTRLKLKNLKDFTLVHFVDIGGQPEFHEILPLLLHGLALNMLFFDLTQNLDSPYTVVYRAEDTGSSHIQYDCEFTIREIIQRALHSISSLQSSTNYSKPAAILVGTHCDKCDRKNISALEQSVQNTFANFIEDCVLCPVSGPGENNKYIHLLDNVSEDCSDIKDLQKLITTVVHDRFKSEPVPISTLLLHLNSTPLQDGAA